MAEIRHLFHISAPQEEVFKCIANVDGIKQWWTAQTYGNADLGGVLNFDFSTRYHNEFEVVKREEGEELVWKCRVGADDWIGSEVHFVLDQNDGKTRVRFGHVNFRDLNDFMAHCSFTWARYLMSLRDLCEKGQGDPFKE